MQTFRASFLNFRNPRKFGRPGSRLAGAILRWPALVLTLTFVFLATPSWSAPGDLLWHDYFGTSGNTAYGVVLKGSTTYVAGMVYGPNGWYLKAYNTATGAKKWETTPADAGILDGLALGGSILFAAGRKFDANNNAHPVLRAYSASNGAFLWEIQDTNTNVRHDHGIPFAANGSTMAAALNQETSNQARITAISAKTKASLWNVGFGRGSGDNWCSKVILTKSFLVAAGQEKDTTYGKTYWSVRALDPKTGAEKWFDKFGLGGKWNGAFDASLSGSLIIAGGYGTETVGGPDVGLLRAYDAKTGALKWSKNFSLSATYTDIWNVAVNKTNIVVSGQYETATNTWAGFLVAYDLNGNYQWTKTFDQADETAIYALVAGQTKVYVAGVVKTYNVNTLSWLLQAYDLAGNFLWNDQFDPGGAHSNVYGLALTSKSLIAVGNGEDAADNGEWVVRALAP